MLLNYMIQTIKLINKSTTGKSDWMCKSLYLISLSLKRQLTDKSAVNKHQIMPAIFSKALEKLTNINPFYENITIANDWENLSEQSDPELWKLLTKKNAKESYNRDQTDSDDNIERNEEAFFTFSGCDV